MATMGRLPSNFKPPGEGESKWYGPGLACCQGAKKAARRSPHASHWRSVCLSSQQLVSASIRIFLKPARRRPPRLRGASGAGRSPQRRRGANGLLTEPERQQGDGADLDASVFASMESASDVLRPDGGRRRRRRLAQLGPELADDGRQSVVLQARTGGAKIGGRAPSGLLLDRPCLSVWCPPPSAHLQDAPLHVPALLVLEERIHLREALPGRRGECLAAEAEELLCRWGVQILEVRGPALAERTGAHVDAAGPIDTP